MAANNSKVVLVTGGTGYIGSHCVVCLLEAGYSPVIFDNFSNSSPNVMERLEKITGRKVPLFQGDLRDRKALKEVFEQYRPDSVIHFAGLKAVNESLSMPLEYYENNFNGTVNLLYQMRESKVQKIVFSSSATVYGGQDKMPIDETASVTTTTPYGSSKLFIEYLLKDYAQSNNDFRAGILRYFNPVGAHQSGLIGERPNGIPNNLMPFITQTAKGIRPKLRVFGNDYPTVDGSGVRDFIHVMDLAESHISMLEHLHTNTGAKVYNVGTGRGTSVLQLIEAFERENKVKVPYEIVERRQGDIATCYADASKIEREIGWKAKRDLTQMVQDSWRWEKLN
jgi:UDP-glucose 4-epimerase